MRKGEAAVGEGHRAGVDWGRLTTTFLMVTRENKHKLKHKMAPLFTCRMTSSSLAADTTSLSPYSSLPSENWHMANAEAR